MPSSAVIQTQDLISALSGDSPVGTDLRADPDSDFYELKSRRAEARTLEDRQSGTPDWPGVVKLATGILAKKSKDLDVLAWLIESLTRVHRFAGLRDGLIVARGLIGQYWDTMHPPFDPEDRSQRLRILGGLNGSGSGSLLPALRLIPLVEGSLSEPPGSGDRPVPLSMFAWSQASSIGKASLESATALVRASSDVYLRNMLDDVRQSRDEVNELEKLLAEKCAASEISVVSFEPIGRVLDEISNTYMEIAGGRLAVADAPVAEKPQGPVETVAGAGTRPTAGIAAAGDLKTRKQALSEIRRIASYFESSEPQSIIGPALHQVASWGEMPLGDLLKTFVPEADHRKMFSWLGIEPKPEKTDS